MKHSLPLSVTSIQEPVFLFHSNPFKVPDICWKKKLNQGNSYFGQCQLLGRFKSIISRVIRGACRAQSVVQKAIPKVQGPTQDGRSPPLRLFSGIDSSDWYTVYHIPLSHTPRGCTRRRPYDLPSSSNQYKPLWAKIHVGVFRPQVGIGRLQHEIPHLRLSPWHTRYEPLSRLSWSTCDGRMFVDDKSEKAKLCGALVLSRLMLWPSLWWKHHEARPNHACRPIPLSKRHDDDEGKYFHSISRFDWRGSAGSISLTYSRLDSESSTLRQTSR